MADKTDLVFKKTVDRQYTTNSKQWYEENPGTRVNIKGSNVFVEPIPETPPSSSNSVIIVYNPLVLTKDDTVGSNRAWLARVTPGDSGSARLRNFIPPRYGSGYAAILYDHVNTVVALTSAAGWFFDYENGVLTFDNNPGSYGFNVTSFKVDIFQYVGRTVDDMVKYDTTLGNLWINPNYEES